MRKIIMAIASFVVLLLIVSIKTEWELSHYPKPDLEEHYEIQTEEETTEFVIITAQNEVWQCDYNITYGAE